MSCGRLSLVNTSLLPIIKQILLPPTEIQLKELAKKNLTRTLTTPLKNTMEAPTLSGLHSYYILPVQWNEGTNDVGKYYLFKV